MHIENLESALEKRKNVLFHLPINKKPLLDGLYSDLLATTTFVQSSKGDIQPISCASVSLENYNIPESLSGMLDQVPEITVIIFLDTDTSHLLLSSQETAVSFVVRSLITENKTTRSLDLRVAKTDGTILIDQDVSENEQIVSLFRDTLYFLRTVKKEDWKAEDVELLSGSS